MSFGAYLPDGLQRAFETLERENKSQACDPIWAQHQKGMGNELKRAASTRPFE